jgi:PLP dependent protein
MPSDIVARLGAVRERIAAACRRAGRPEDAVELVAVGKGHPSGLLRAALQAGQRSLGENYAQELVAKAGALSGLGVRWHFVGGLQRNKVRKIVGLATVIQTVDDSALAVEIDRRAAALGAVQDILVQVNVAGEPQKSGVAPPDLGRLLDVIAGHGRLRCLGLMAIPPESENARPHFRALAALATAHGLRDLSMGMSQDFEVAIEEGATMVRVGSAIFGPRLGP